MQKSYKECFENKEVIIIAETRFEYHYVHSHQGCDSAPAYLSVSLHSLKDGSRNTKREPPPSTDNTPAVRDERDSRGSTLIDSPQAILFFMDQALLSFQWSKRFPPAAPKRRKNLSPAFTFPAR